MRPDVAAFRELDTLVRNLSEQLAGYRRRALASESRTRELEQQLAASVEKLSGVQSVEPRLAVTSESTGSLAEENERLRARLSEARERTVQVADRVRFLRQQLGTAVDR